MSDAPEVTRATQIGLTWLAPAFDGGSPVDYRLWSDSATNGATYTTIIDKHPSLSFTVTGLNKGATYKFKVEARNKYGYSLLDSQVTILAAQVPD